MDQPHKLLISKAATAQLEKTLAKHPGKFLRITVFPGGCNGFEYKLDLDETVDEKEDVRFTPSESVAVVVDTTSLEIISGATLDYEAELIGAAFKITNPNAATSCGCGNSFSI